MRNHRNLYATAFEGIEDYQIKPGLSELSSNSITDSLIVESSPVIPKSNSSISTKPIMKCLITESQQCDINQNYHINSNQ